jgi:hypothetical protein
MTIESMLATNVSRLVRQPVRGEVWPPVADRHAYRTDADGTPFILPGMGGVTLGVHPGDIATGYATDHLEPGLSIRHRETAANYALQFLTCIGNVITVRSGPASGASGRVVGQHAFVLANLPPADMEKVAPGDVIDIMAFGQGLKLLDHPQIVVKNSDPDLLRALGVHTGADGRLVVPVARIVPPEAIGAGTGMNSEYANTDLMGIYVGQGEDLNIPGLDELRIGDLVALPEQDHRYGRGWRPDWVTIGVIGTGHARLFGHGPGPSSIMAGPAELFDIVVEPTSNVKNAFDIMGTL